LIWLAWASEGKADMAPCGTRDESYSMEKRYLQPMAGRQLEKCACAKKVDYHQAIEYLGGYFDATFPNLFTRL
jgi:hypothetical protein